MISPETSADISHYMHQSKKLLITLLAIIVGCGSMIVPSVAVSADDLYFMCYRGQTIQIPFYLRTRYLAKGAVDNACPASAQ